MNIVVNISKKIVITLVSALICFNALADDGPVSTELPKIEEGIQYLVMPKFASPDREVVELFSFNCPSCMRFDNEFKIPQTIKDNLPQGVTFKKYHLSSFGPLAPELAQAWAIANVLGITEEVSQQFYTGIQQDRTIKTADDIKAVFVNLGVDENDFENMKNNALVKAFMIQQLDAEKELQPDSIPSFYVNRKYFINSRGLYQGTDMSSNDAIIADFSRVANHLSTLN